MVLNIILSKLFDVRHTSLLLDTFNHLAVLVTPREDLLSSKQKENWEHLVELCFDQLFI